MKSAIVLKNKYPRLQFHPCLPKSKPPLVATALPVFPMWAVSTALRYYSSKMHATRDPRRSESSPAPCMTWLKRWCAIEPSLGVEDCFLFVSLPLQMCRTNWYKRCFLIKGFLDNRGWPEMELPTGNVASIETPSHVCYMGLWKAKYFETGSSLKNVCLIHLPLVYEKDFDFLNSNLIHIHESNLTWPNLWLTIVATSFWLI